MKDFPLFTTENGVASLILREIPYRKEAFIQIRDTQDPEELLEECVSLCRICGAEKIYAAGHPFLAGYPMHTAIWQYRGTIPMDPSQVKMLWPVTEESVTEWIRIANEKMRSVPNAATLTDRDKNRILESAGAYFIHDNGELLGIGWLDGTEIRLIASVKKGAGIQILTTLQSLCPDVPLDLEVASENAKAVSLYERAGLLRAIEKNIWYTVKYEELSSKNT